MEHGIKMHSYRPGEMTFIYPSGLEVTLHGSVNDVGAMINYGRPPPPPPSPQDSSPSQGE